MKVLLATSVLVPALPQHEKAAPHLEAAFSKKIDLVVRAHALAECYASLTALPTSPSVTPGQARRLIEENVTQRANEVLALAGTDYTEALQRMADRGLTSGAVYDMLHVICDEKAEADELRTFNGQDVRRMPPSGSMELVII